MSKKATRLGRGLGSLISNGGTSAPKTSQPVKKAKTVKKTAKSPKPTQKPQNNQKKEPQVEPTGYRELSVELIEVNPHQPRRDFHESQLKELASSISSEGLLQPVVVRKKPDGRYELIAGERRWRACKSLKMSNIPARVVEVSDKSSAVIALIENLQRENLNPVDEALGYASLMKDFDMTQEAVSDHVGKPRASVANALRLLQLGPELQGYLSKGLISVGHAKVLLGVENASQRSLLARRIIEQGLSVRDAEKLVKGLRDSKISSNSQGSRPSMQSAVIQDLEKQMRAHFSTSVKIAHGAKKGKITIEYKGNDDLNRILERIGFLSKQGV